MIEFSLELALLLWALAVFAGWMDTLVGGGGLITVPGLMLTGLPPVSVLATNKFQGCSGTLTASVVLFRARHLSWETMRYPMLWAGVGSAVGAILVRTIDQQTLTFIIPIVLIFTACYFLFSPFVKRQAAEKAHPRVYQRVAVPAIGLYDGALGPGTGSFFAMAAASLQKLDLLTAVKQAKALNFATNAAALIVFASLGEVAWKVGFVMVSGQIIGAWLGARSLFRIHPNLLRPGIVIVCLIMLAINLTQS